MLEEQKKPALVPVKVSALANLGQVMSEVYVEAIMYKVSGFDFT